jgi:hypothetical protein
VFERFKSARKVMRADKTARHVMLFLKPCLIFVWKTDGGIHPELQADEFMLGYVYGVVAACAEVFKISDQEEVGYLIQQVFDRLFPGQGRSVTGICNQHALEKSTEFVRSTRLGFSEMMETFETFDPEGDGQEQKVLHSLMHHVASKAAGE